MTIVEPSAARREDPGVVVSVEATQPLAPATATRRRRPMDVLGPVLVFALFVGSWYGLNALMSANRKFLVPMPHKVIDVAFLQGDNRAELLRGLWLSTQVALVGLGLAIVVGMVLAIAMSQARWVERSVYPYLVALQAIPILAFVPLIGALFDFSFRARVIVCVIIALFPIVANTLFGLLNVDRSQHELFTLQGAGRLTRLRKLQLPAAMPSIFNGFRIAAGLSVIGAVVGDFFFRQGQAGIGQQIDVYYKRLRGEEMYGAVILSSALGIAVFLAFGWLSRFVVGHWYQPTRHSD